MGNGCVEQYTVTAQFHRDGDITPGADAGIDDYWIIGVTILEILENDADVVWVENPLPAADRATRQA